MASHQVIHGRDLRKVILEQSMRAHVGHIGSALSIADIIAGLYSGILSISSPHDLQRDRFILSKGHAALALYAALHLRGWMTGQQLSTFCGDDSLLGVHPDSALEGVEFSTGSLGHGPCLGAGCALAARLQGLDFRTFVLMSDAECNEGSVWEAASFAGHHGLSNLVFILDMDGQQALGYTRDVLTSEGMSGRWTSLGWEVREVDGHNMGELSDVMARQRQPKDKPLAVVAHTTFGKGVSFMEGMIKWHYLPMSDEQFRLAMKEVAGES